MKFIIIDSGDYSVGLWGSEVTITVDDPDEFISYNEEVKEKFEHDMKEFLKNWSGDLAEGRIAVMTEDELKKLQDDFCDQQEELHGQFK